MTARGGTDSALPESVSSSVSQNAPSDAAVTLPTAAGSGNRQSDSWNRRVTENEGEIETAAFRELFSAAIGEKVSLPLTVPLEGLVNMNHLHDNGARSLGIALDGFKGGFAFLEQEADGKIAGHITIPSRNIALKIEPANDPAKLRARTIAIDKLMCARVHEGKVLGGLAMATERDEESLLDILFGEDPPEETNSDIPSFQSRPGSSKVLYLDFDGETVTGSSWNSHYNNGQPIEAAPFDNYSYIERIWESVAEDYLPFDVNVTTDRGVYEAAYYRNRCMAILTPSKSWYGSAGGVAYTGSFGSSSNYMCFVFNSSLNGAAEAASHESGHQLGLSHDGTSTSSYYTGHTHPNGIEWGPVMGVSYGKDIVQFSKGEYNDANQTENDLSILQNELSYRPDDHGNSTSTATIPPDMNTGRTEIAGIIEKESDSDLFRIGISQSGHLNFQAAPGSVYGNLDIHLQLLDAQGSVIAESAPGHVFNASVSASSRPAGVYYVRVMGDNMGTAANGYTRYGSIGSYRLTGTFPASQEPIPPDNLSATDGTSTDYVQLDWDPVAFAEGYRVYRSTSSSASNATFLAEVTSASYQDRSAPPHQIYYYFVRSYNALGQSALSSPESGYRGAQAATPGGLSASDGSYSSYTRVSWSSAAYAAGYYVYRNTVNSTAGAVSLGHTTGTTYYDSTGFANIDYFYFVQAENAAGTSGFSVSNSGRRSAALNTPGSVSATQSTLELTVFLKWNAVSGAGGYYIYRNTVNDKATSIEVGQSSTTSFYDSSAEAGIGYYYFVRAVGNSGDSALSNGVLGVAGARDPGDDEYEANDRLSAAYPLQSAEGTWLSAFHGPAVAADEDWFAIKTQSGATRIDVLVQSSGLPEDFDVHLYSSTGSVLMTAETTGGDRLISYPTAKSSATYYILVNPRGDSSTPYNLVWKSLRPDDSPNRVDMTIGTTPVSQLGQYFYTANAQRQAVKDKLKGRRTKKVIAKATNEGTEDAIMTMSATRSNRLLQTKYIAYRSGSAANVTAAIQRSAAKDTYAPLEKAMIQMMVRPTRQGAKKQRRHRLYVSTSINGATGTVDATGVNLSMKAKRKRGGKRSR